MLTAYTRAPSVPVVSHRAMRPYTLALRDLPSQEKPREKLLSAGPEALGLSELLAVILGVGTKKEELRAMTARIVKEYGEKSITGMRHPKKLAQHLDIPLGHALQIVAAVELGRRLFDRNPSGAAVIRNAADVYEYAKDMRALSKEHLRGIYLGSHYKVVHDEVISIGTVDANIIHPREVFRPALEYAAAAVILVHNHPSGMLEPSEADLLITRQIIEAGSLLGIELIDHVIVGREGFTSIVDRLS